eukprot:TRINITY_DN15895_c0_g1_i1.p3 TRINITY_DN15895_c0_g1~~TRINITY_DN15895_c0_g1_i1.p3  ORF type:complete len:115 (+),score=14.48 TRINITY_DN15895_c0_g1_i1:93-437(+)
MCIRDRSIINCDFNFLIGDTNFRLSQLNQTQVKPYISLFEKQLYQNRVMEAKESLNWLLTSDELKFAQKECQLFSNYIEGDIKFLPTYKYDLNDTVYDSSKKQRTPAWCDRILI